MRSTIVPKREGSCSLHPYGIIAGPGREARSELRDSGRLGRMGRANDLNISPATTLPSCISFNIVLYISYFCVSHGVPLHSRPPHPNQPLPDPLTASPHNG